MGIPVRDFDLGEKNPFYLCLIHDEYAYPDYHKCVSNIMFTVDETQEEKAVEISSFTNPYYLRKKINTLLRAVIILMAAKMGMDYVKSLPVNELSKHTMVKHFNAFGYSHRHLDYSKRSSETDDYYFVVDLHDPVSIPKAQQVFDSIVKDFDCKKTSREKLQVLFSDTENAPLFPSTIPTTPTVSLPPTARRIVTPRHHQVNLHPRRSRRIQSMQRRKRHSSSNVTQGSTSRNFKQLVIQSSSLPRTRGKFTRRGGNKRRRISRRA